MTHDGVVIKPGQKYFSVKVKEWLTAPGLKSAPLWSIAGPYINPKATDPTGDIIFFSTRETAEQFVNDNKK